MNRLLVDILIE